MENQIKFLSLILIFLVLLSIPVYAVGSSTGARTQENNRAVDPIPAVGPVAIFCEDDRFNPDCVCRTGVKQIKRCDPPEVPQGIAIDPEECLMDVYECISPQTPRERIISKKAELKEQYKNRNCETLETTRERIRCRLSRGETYTAPTGNVPEACRRLVSIDACQGLYRNLQRCYSLNGADKDRCFKKVIEFKKANLAEETENREEKARNYIVALLYDLQERIEKMNENGEINPDSAATLIEKIVDLKEAILSDKSRTEVRTLFQEFKQMWRNTILENE